VLLGIEPARGPAASASDVFRRNPHYLENRTLYYSGAIGTAEGFAGLILDQVEAFDQRLAAA
jgi:hypothetical protein